MNVPLQNHNAFIMPIKGNASQQMSPYTRTLQRINKVRKWKLFVVEDEKYLPVVSIPIHLHYTGSAKCNWLCDNY